MSFSNALERNLNTTETENGAKAFKSSLNSNLDLFFGAGAVRASHNPIKERADMVLTFKKALAEDKDLAIRNLINIRNFRLGGMGERELFRRLYLALDKETRLEFVPIVPIIGRWDDLVNIFYLTTDKELKQQISVFIINNINDDLESERPSLLAKWLPSDKGSRATSEEKEFIHSLGFKQTRDYRKILSRLRSKLNLVETKLSKKDYDEIDVANLPSRAFNFYKKALWRHKAEDMESLNKKVESGEVKIKMDGVTPNEIVKQMRSYHSGNIEATLESQWSSFSKEDGNDDVLVMADVSGSMSYWADGVPMDVSIALAIYFSERAKGEFHNKFMTFSSKPSFVSYKDGMSLADKVRLTEKSDWENGTNIDAAFDAILETAIENHLHQDELPKTLLVVSDMQFDEATYNYKSNLEYAQSKFEQYGYKLPNIVFWNVAGTTNTPATVYDKNTSLVSGFTPSVMKSIMEMDEDAFTPDGIMMKQLHSEQIDKIMEMLKQ